MAKKFDTKKFKQLLKDVGLSQMQVALEILRGKRTTRYSTMSKYVNRKRLPPDNVLQRAAIFISEHTIPKRKVDISEFCILEESEAEPLAYFELQKIYDYFEPLGENDVISIVSPDGFLEAHEKDLFEMMIDQVGKEVQIRYYYLSEVDNPSLKDFRILLEMYKKRLSPSVAQEHILGFQVSPKHRQLFGWKTRYVVISQWDQNRDNQEVKHVFLYTESSHPVQQDSSKTKVARVWIRLEENAGREYYTNLCGLAEPVCDIGVYSNSLISGIQDLYRNAFQHEPNIKIYQAVRGIAKTDKIVMKPIVERINKWWKKNKPAFSEFPVVRILDIGSGDGVVTQQLLRAITSIIGGLGTIRLAAVESARIKRELLNKCLTEPSTLSVTSTFEDFDPYGNEFDLIFTVHSMYLIDPSHFLKMYSILSDNGMIVVVSAPYDNNILNLFCSHVDDCLPEADPRIGQLRPYAGKVITQDPYRNYAEDLHVAAKECFHENAVSESYCESEVSLSLFITDDNHLTQLGHDIISLFSFGQLPQKKLKQTEKKIIKDILKVSKNGVVRNDNWILSVTKSDVRQHLGNHINGKVV